MRASDAVIYDADALRLPWRICEMWETYGLRAGGGTCEGCRFLANGRSPRNACWKHCLQAIARGLKGAWRPIWDGCGLYAQY